jgi:small-conductance mechanosensitive channel
MFIISDLYFKIEQLLRDRNIEIPFPHRDIQFRDPNLSLGLSKDVENALLHWLQNHNHHRINHRDS